MALEHVGATGVVFATHQQRWQLSGRKRCLEPTRQTGKPRPQSTGVRAFEPLKPKQKDCGRLFNSNPRSDCGRVSRVCKHVGCVRPLSLSYSDASADEVEERSLVPLSRSAQAERDNESCFYNRHSYGDQCRDPEPGSILRTGLELESRTWLVSKRGTGTEPNLKSQASLGLAARSFRIKDEGIHSTSTRPKPRAER
ncbi:hypothetical protein EVAR_35664_1 [Eumeta japonica]|uniref:Uncharacterized protein n=1 Tax=Eumeta variegata TaxID=151549 RepID=A0A4C1VED8_EUMVA|nr:hypothetical protein EVAR_35664_1 [Eumeta japonica]